MEMPSDDKYKVLECTRAGKTKFEGPHTGSDSAAEGFGFGKRLDLFCNSKY